MNISNIGIVVKPKHQKAEESLLKLTSFLEEKKSITSLIRALLR